MNQTQIVRIRKQLDEFLASDDFVKLCEISETWGITFIVSDILDSSCLNKGANKMVRYEQIPLYYIRGKLNRANENNTIAHVGKVADQITINEGIAIARSFEGFAVYCDDSHNDALSHMSTIEEVEAYFGAKAIYLFPIRQERGPSQFTDKLAKMDIE